MLRLGSNDLMPLVLLLGAALGAWIFNRISGARPGRRRRRSEPPKPPASTPQAGS